MLQFKRYPWFCLTITVILSLPACAAASPYLLASADDGSAYTPTELRSAAGSTFLYWPQLTYLDDEDVEARALFIFQGRVSAPPLLGSVTFVGNTRSSGFDDELRVTDVEVTAVWFSQPLATYTQRQVADDLEDYLEHRTIVVPNDTNLAQARQSTSVYVYSARSVGPPLGYLTFGWYSFPHASPHHVYRRAYPRDAWRERDPRRTPREHSEDARRRRDPGSVPARSAKRDRNRDGGQPFDSPATRNVRQVASEISPPAPRGEQHDRPSGKSAGHLGGSTAKPVAQPPRRAASVTRTARPGPAPHDERAATDKARGERASSNSRSTKPAKKKRREENAAQDDAAATVQVAERATGINSARLRTGGAQIRSK